jgi:hypothetical protein
VVTLLTVPPLEVPLDEDDDVSLDWELVEPVVVVSEVVVVAGVEATVVAADEELAEDFLASAGSCPETSVIVINSQAATNSATDPATIRRRMLRARATRALLSACPRARAASAFLSVMSCTSLSV